MTKSLTYVEIDVPDFASGSPEADQTWRFAVPTDYLPADIDAIPSIESVDFTPAMISLGKDLGQRASLRVSLRDHKHIFNGEDFDSGTFFGKWRARYGTKLRGRAIRLIRGQLGQSLAEMDTRHYVIDTTDGPDFGAVYTITAKDILKFADDERAKAPMLSNGSLAGSIDGSTTSATLSPTGIGNLEYPASGWVNIGGDEVCAFTRSADALTITRGQFGSIASGHDAGDRVQLVLRYTGDDVADIIHELLTDYAGVSGDYINLAEWQAETAAYLGVIYAATITEPISVNKLVSELIEQTALAVWWDDQALKIRLQVLREIATDTDTFDADRIIEGSFSVKEQPDKRISQIWTRYGQRDPTDQSDNKDNYRAVLADVDAERETDYGSAEIREVQARWIETESAATRLNSIQLSRFRDPPRTFGFDLFRDLNIVPAAGYQIKWWGNQDETGVEVPALIQVTQVTTYPDRIHVEAEEMLATGVIVLVNVVFLTGTGSVLQWALPETWNDADNSVSCIAGGAGGSQGGTGGSSANAGGRGGGAGAFSQSTNLALMASPLPMIDYRVGAGGAGGTFFGGGAGGDTFFNGSALASCLVGAEGGDGGSGRTGGGAGGLAANGTGDLKTSGGNGGNGNFSSDDPTGGGGGGGAGGPNGDGADSNQGGTNDAGGNGGGGADGGFAGAGADINPNGGAGGNNRFNFGGGTAGVSGGADPGPGNQGGGGGGGAYTQDGATGGTGEQLWTQTVAPIISAGPGGGAGGGGRAAQGGLGGLYGGGGGGGGQGANGGAGWQGIIVIQWREAE